MSVWASASGMHVLEGDVCPHIFISLPVFVAPQQTSPFPLSPSLPRCTQNQVLAIENPTARPTAMERWAGKGRRECQCQQGFVMSGRVVRVAGVRVGCQVLAVGGGAKRVKGRRRGRQ